MANDLSVRTYDPSKIIVTWGPTIVTGFNEGTFLTIARNGQAFEKSKGADGTIDRINRNAFDFTINLTIKQTSITNDIFSAALQADLLTNVSKLPFTVKDVNGLSLFFAPLAGIQKDPDAEYSDALSGREWIFDTGPGANFIGGNIL